MPSIDEAMRDRRGRRRRRLAAGVGLLLAGALLVGVGAAGAAEAAVVPNGAVIGGLAVLGGLVVLADRAPLGERERTVTATGAAVGLAGLLLYWAVAPAGRPTGALAIGAATVYAFGIAGMLGAVLAGTSLGLGAPESEPAFAWERTDDGRSIEATADGGAADDGRPFPAEDD